MCSCNYANRPSPTVISKSLSTSVLLLADNPEKNPQDEVAPSLVKTRGKIDFD